MNDTIDFIQTSGFRFFLYRAFQYTFQSIATWFYSLIWRPSLGSFGAATSLSPSVTIMAPRQIHLGNNCKILARVRLLTDVADAKLVIGDSCVIGSDNLIDFSGGIVIGKQTEFSEQVIVYTHDHAHHDYRVLTSKPLTIGTHVRFRARCIILPSVGHIGDNSVIGAGAVVTKPVPSGVLVAGNPASVVKKLSQ